MTRVPRLSHATLPSRSVALAMFRWACSLALVALLGGCAKQAASPAMSAPEGETAAVSAGGEVDLVMLEQDLATREEQLRLAGVAVPVAGATKSVASEEAAGSAPDDEAAPATATPSVTADQAAPPQPAEAGEIERQRMKAGPAPADRCTTVCELTTSICQLREQICAMAPRHPGEPRYEAACQRASQDCEIATEACHACT